MGCKEPGHPYHPVHGAAQLLCSFSGSVVVEFVCWIFLKIFSPINDFVSYTDIYSE